MTIFLWVAFLSLWNSLSKVRIFGIIFIALFPERELHYPQEYVAEKTAWNLMKENVAHEKSVVSSDPKIPSFSSCHDCSALF